MSYFGSKDWLIEVNKGNIPGHSLIHKFGHNNDVDAGVEEDIWETGGSYVPLIAGVQFEVASSSVNDAAAGTHARTIILHLLKSDFTETTETITLNGTTAVTTTGTDYIRCNRKEVDEVGTYNVSNDGIITTKVVGGGATQATIDVGSGQTHKTHYTIPAGKTGYLLRVSLSADAAKVCTFYMVKRENPNGLNAPYKAHRHMHEWVGVDAPADENFKANHVIPEKTDIWAEAIPVANNTSVQLDYDLLLVDN